MFGNTIKYSLYYFSKFTLFLLLTLGFGESLQGQELNYPEVTHRPDVWQGSWITHPKIAQGEAAMLHFRKTFFLDEVPKKCVINITADNYYTLYVNEKKVCFGPQLGDIKHWRFETLDLAAYLKPGNNTVAVKVVNWGYHRFFGKQSVHTALTINAYNEQAKMLSTNLDTKNPWKVLKSSAWHPNIVKWRSAKNDIIGGLYANNPTDSIQGSLYPWGWKKSEFNDSDWVHASFLENTNMNHNSNGFAWLLEPRNLPLLTQKKEYIKSAVRTQNIQVNKPMLRGEQRWIIPPNTKASVLLDHGEVTTGYPVLKYAHGKNAKIKLTYAENLFDAEQLKGDRNKISGKTIVGYKDIIIADGGIKRKYESSWPRTFRFLQFDIQTGSEPLSIDEFYNQHTTTAIPIKAHFKTDDTLYNRIFDISKRTVSLCTQDYFLSDAYYETMQYVGDTKVHAQVWQALSGDDAHTRNALLQFHQSRTSEGLLMNCYPLKANFIHSTFSMIWVDMVYDYLQYSGDTEYVAQFLPGIRHTLSYFINRRQPNGLLGAAKYKYFIDWYVERKEGGGLAPNTDGTNSSVVNLHLAHALQSAAKIFRIFQEEHQADAYLKIAEEIKKSVGSLNYDKQKKLFAERPDKSFYDQHSNIMAVLTNAVPKAEQSDLIERTVNDPDLAQATFYYRYYLLEALKKTNRPDLFKKVLDPWIQLVANNATTVMERFESPYKKSRSEVHPWGTSPLLFYYSLLAGIQQEGIGWNEVKIAPYMRNVKTLSGEYPTPKGVIIFDFSLRGTKGIDVSLEIPEQMKARFYWRGKTLELKEGIHKFSL